MAAVPPRLLSRRHIVAGGCALEAAAFLMQHAPPSRVRERARGGLLQGAGGRGSAAADDALASPHTCAATLLL